MEKNYIEALLLKYENGLCSAEEEAVVSRYYENVAVRTPENFTSEIGTAVEKVRRKMDVNIVLVRKINWPLRIATAAAAIVVLLGLWTVLFVKVPDQPDCDCDNDINPGGNNATLTLPNGKNINLNDVKNGELATGKGVKIIKKADGQLLYVLNPDGLKASQDPFEASEPVEVKVKPVTPADPYAGLCTLKTPKGGEYHIVLPDGTGVWLNAGSVIRFPITFEGLDERVVMLSGEAYFEVKNVRTVLGTYKRAMKKPFIVRTAAQDVMVTGTHFNVDSYADEPNTKTTLLEGEVRISAPQIKAGQTILKPGEQSVSNKSAIRVQKVDTDEVVAWVKGEFAFRHESLEQIMKDVARWYDVEVIYQNTYVKHEVFGGTISRFDKISKVLAALEATSNVKFKITGSKVFVSQ